MANNFSLDEIPECPLCLEPLGLDDINFYPCACRYQICRFCWHRIRTDENGLCPHCREVYPENPAEYTPPTQDQLAKLKSDKKQKETSKRQKVVESREKLGSVRVVQRNLVFVIGLSPRLADPEVLKKNEYFGKFGKIYKVVINNHTIYNGAQGPSVSAYVTYCRSEDASKAIAAVNNAFIDGRSLKASFGTTKYCTSFLKGTLCTKPDCMYLHELGENEASFTKEDMQLGKHQVFENATLASLLPVGSVKDHTPSLSAEGGVKIKHTPIPPRAKEVYQADLAESALPATAHWGSNTKPQGGPDGPLTDVAPPTSKHADSLSPSSGRNTKTPSTKSQEMGTEQASSRQSKKEAQQSDGAVVDSSSPASGAPQRQDMLEESKRSPEHDDCGSSEHSSISKSLTSNLSQSSTLSSPNSELETGGRSRVGVALGVESPAGMFVEMDGCRAKRALLQDEVKGAGFLTTVDSCAEQVNVAQARVDKQVLETCQSEGSGVPIPPMAVRNMARGTSPPISSPPGLSKARAQPLPLSTQSEMICKQMDIDVKPLPLHPEGGVVSQAELMSRDGGQSSNSTQHHRNRQRVVAEPVVTKAALTNDVLSSLTSAGPSHFGALGTNWGHPVPGVPPHHQPRFAPSASLLHAPDLPTSSLTSSAQKRPFAPMSNHLHPHPPVRNHAISPLLPTPTTIGQSRQQVDDGDELGFDPWDVSQQGLADLLETEQKQGKPHPPGLSHSHTHPKRPNGLTSAAFANHKAPTSANIYKNWHMGTPSSTAGVVGGAGPVGGGPAGSSVGGEESGADDTLQDEFRALFPNVNISFGGPMSKSKSEMPSSLVQALDASNPVNSTSYPSHLATALNYSYRNPQLVNSSAQGHAHLAPSKQGGFSSVGGGLPPSSGIANLFLGQSQPGFPASCFKVKNQGGVTATTTPTTSAVAAASSGVSTSNSYTNCLGADWPDLGITLGHNKSVPANMSQSTSMPAMQNKTMPTAQSKSVTEVEPESGASAMWKNSSGTDPSPSLPAVPPPPTPAASSSSSSLPAAAMAPPPGFSKPRVDPSAPPGAGEGTGNVNQTTPAPGTANPLLFKGQVIPNHILQSWSNLRNFSKMTPAQQQLARQQLSLQQQQLLAQQYLFQQALMRNPVLHAQSIRMAQQIQQAALMQQKQQALLAAGVKAGTPNSTASRVNPTTTSPHDATKLVSTAEGTSSLPVASVSVAGSTGQTGSKVQVASTDGGGVGGGDNDDSVHTPSKTGTKGLRQNVTSGGLKGPVHSSGGSSSARSSGQKGLGHPKNSCQVTSNSGQTNSSSALNLRSNEKHHHPSRNSKTSAKPKSGGSGSYPSSSKPRQKTK